ncbi:hypothetical protein K8I61_15965 [bacterium]|nr:hypothetical protein [bacterium]
MTDRRASPGVWRVAAAFVSFAAAAYLFAAMLLDMRLLTHSALSFARHHEAAAPFFVVLSRPVLALACFLTGARFLHADASAGAGARAPIALAGLAGVMMVVSRLLENEAFYALYDPKGYPVHPPEVIMFPRSGWVSPAAQLGAALLLAVAAGVLVLATRSRGDRAP